MVRNHDGMVLQRLHGDFHGPLQLSVVPRGHGRGIILDLEQVRLVDRDAVLFLALSETTGVKLRNCSAFIREWITQEKSAMDRNKSEDPTGFAE